MDAPPATGTACTSGAPSRVLVNATVSPSGDSRAPATGTPSAVSRHARPPAASVSQTSFSATNAIRSPRMLGKRRYARSAVTGTT